jgi:hypothetical protein
VRATGNRFVSGNHQVPIASAITGRGQFRSWKFSTIEAADATCLGTDSAAQKRQVVRLLSRTVGAS